MSRYWNRVDLNRIPEQEMNDFASRFPAVAQAWQELKRKCGMCVSILPPWYLASAMLNYVRS